MAIELLSDSSGMSPRLSFSHDLCIPGATPIEPYHTRRSSSNSNSFGSPDFDFCVGKSFGKESSAADELFSDGKIVPSDQIKKRATQEMDGPSSSSSSSTLSQKQSSSLKEMEAAEDKQQTSSSGNNNSSKSSSFWRFKRSSSGGSGSYGRSLCRLPLMSRSYSTGSSSASASVKRGGNTNQKHLKQQFSSKSSSSQSSSCQKPPLKKNYGNYNVSPVLNVPAGNLFGLGSLFSSSPKDKNKKK